MFSSRHLMLRNQVRRVLADKSRPAQVLCLSFATGALALGPGLALADQAQSEAEKIVRLEEVVVTGSQVSLPDAYAGGQVARGGRVGIFGNLDMMDTPFTSTNYTAELILEQQSKGVGDVLLNDPVVRVARGFGNFQELYKMRGFATYSDDITYNGIYGILPRQFVAAEFLERVEIFRGANSFMNGAAPGGSSVGGTINLVPKRAPEKPLTRVTVGFENSGHVYGGIDVGRRFGGGNEFGTRVNVFKRGGETSVDGQDRELDVLAFGLDYDGERFRMAADIGYQDHHLDAPRPSVTPQGSGVPAPPDASSNYAQPWTLSEEKEWFGVVRGEYDLTDGISVWAALGGRSGTEYNILANPNSQPDGTLSLIRFDNYRKDEIYSGEAGLRTEFATGPVKHRVILSGSVFSLDSKNAYAFSSFSRFPNDLYNPYPVPAPPATAFTGGVLFEPLTTRKNQTRSLAIADMVSLFDDRVLLTLGLRDQTIDNETFDYNTGASNSRYDESEVTPIAGLVLKRGDRWAFYGNFAESLVPGQVAPAVSGGAPVTNAGQVFKPYASEQYEIGVKYDGGRFGGTVAAFSLSRPSSIVENQVFSVDGEQRNRGIELGMFGEPVEGFRLIGGLTWLDTEITRSQGHTLDGKTPVGAPDLQVNLNAEWDVPAVRNLTLDGRVMYTSDQYINSANTITLPSWTRLDLGARYSTTVGERPLTVRLRVDNLTDAADWVSAGGEGTSNYMVLGNPRTFTLSASVEF